MARFKNADWNLTKTPSGNISSWEEVNAALLMDLRDELQKLNNLFHCINFTSIPAVLKVIETNTKKRPRKKADAK